MDFGNSLLEVAIAVTVAIDIGMAVAIAISMGIAMAIATAIGMGIAMAIAVTVARFIGSFVIHRMMNNCSPSMDNNFIIIRSSKAY